MNFNIINTLYASINTLSPLGGVGGGSFLFIDWQPSLELFGVLRWYSLMWCIGLLLAYVMVHKGYRQQSIPEEKFEPLFFYCFIGTLIGARLGHCLGYESSYYLGSIRGFIEMFLPIRFTDEAMTDWQFRGYEGLASHGGAVGIILMMILYAKMCKVKMFTVIDNVALAVPLVACCIRLGNLMNSEIIGNPTDMPWGFIFHTRDALVNGELAPRHPAQLYEAIAYLIIFFVQYYIYKKHDLPLYPKAANATKTPSKGMFQATKKEDVTETSEALAQAEKKSFIGKGFYFGFTIATIFFFRFFVEFLKKEQVDFEQGMTLNLGQLYSIPFVLLGSWLIWNAIRKAKK